MYLINPDKHLTVLTVGFDKTPIIVIDNLLIDHQAVINHAVTQAKFVPEQHSFYPGMRAVIDEDYQNTLLPFIQKLLPEYYTITSADNAQPQVQLDGGFYSLLSRVETMLEPEQCIPHFDSKDANYFAVTHYLNPGDFSGTAIYRHKQTNIENVTHANIDVYFSAINQYVAEHGMFEQKYISGSTDLYELLEVIPYKPNRLVIYPGSLLHSIFIDDVAKNVIIDPKKGRLTANLFLKFK